MPQGNQNPLQAKLQRERMGREAESQGRNSTIQSTDGFNLLFNTDDKVKRTKQAPLNIPRHNYQIPMVEKEEFHPEPIIQIPEQRKDYGDHVTEEPQPLPKKKGWRKDKVQTGGDEQPIYKDTRKISTKLEENELGDSQQENKIKYKKPKLPKGQKNHIKKTGKVKKRQRKLEEESKNVLRNYKVLRKELISGYMRIDELDLVGKIKLAIRYKNEKSGKAEEKRKREELKKVRYENSKYNALMIALQDLTKPVIEGRSLERRVKLDKAYGTVLDKVTQSSDFRGLSFETPEQNENYSKYIKDFPILLVIKKEGDGSVI